MTTDSKKRLLLLTAGYGEGHNSAARALSQEFSSRHWNTKCLCPLEYGSSRDYELSRNFYAFCISRAGLLWGLTYEWTDGANWAKLAQKPPLLHGLNFLRDLLEDWKPDLIICTYPVFGYLLDELKKDGSLRAPYAVVVTDSIVISRPWLRSDADVIFVPDEYSYDLVVERYAIDETKLELASFPVESRFYPNVLQAAPRAETLSILYAANAPYAQVCEEIIALLHQYPLIKLTVLSSTNAERLREHLLCHFSSLPAGLLIVSRSECMDELFRACHIYIGKAGAASLYEAYASAVPIIINHALMGQEQGNLELLRADGCGLHLESPSDLLRGIDYLLSDCAAAWLQMRRGMMHFSRRGGAGVIADCLERRM